MRRPVFAHAHPAICGMDFTIRRHFYGVTFEVLRMEPIFRDEGLEEKLSRQGYVVVPFIDGEDVDALLQSYERTNKEFLARRLYETSRANDPELNDDIAKHIYQVFLEPCENLFQNFKLFGGSFIVKSHLNKTEFKLHQDWTVVEEDKVNSVLVWCALCDVTVENGSIFVIDGSHNLFDAPRSGSIKPLRVPANDDLRPYYKPIPVPKGHAFVFYDRLFHGSYPNQTEIPRVVAQARIMPKDAELIYWHKHDDGRIGVYQVSHRFYTHEINDLDQGVMPKGMKLLRWVEEDIQPLTEAQLMDALQNRLPQLVE